MSYRAGNKSFSALTRVEQDEESLQHHDAAEVDRQERHGEGGVDESTFDEEIYVVEAVLEDSDGYADRPPRDADHREQEAHRRHPPGHAARFGDDERGDRPDD